MIARLLYFLLFATVGVFTPWVPPWLASRGFGERGIGLVLAASTGFRAVFPPLWGEVADRSGASRGIFSVTVALAGLSLAILVVPLGSWGIVAGLLAYGFLFVPSVPLLEALTVHERGAHYGRVRLWGSLGFIVTSLGVGALVTRAGIRIVPLAAGLPLVLAGIVGLRMRQGTRPAERGGSERAARGPGTPPRAVAWRPLVLVLGAATLGQGSHGPYYAFFSLQLESRGVAAPVIGALWTLGVLAEVALMAASPAIFARVGLASSMRIALALTVVRWAGLALAPPLAIIALLQLLHAASYALLHTASLQLVDALTPPGRKAFGQSLLSAMAYGVGVSGGLALAGLLSSSWSSSQLYVAAAVTAGAGLLLAAFVRSPPRAGGLAHEGSGSGPPIPFSAR